ncbi:MAG: PDZ domain-containing protein [Candidatus Binataceae bacterium]|jgi:hypothetical protein
MNIGRNLLIPLIVLAFSVASNSAASAAGGDVAASQSQTGAQSAPSDNGPQAHGALEIAPQGNMQPPSVSAPATAPSGNPANETASYEQYQRPVDTETKPAKTPYLGIVAEDTLKNYGGHEEHGLEIITIDSDSPAAQAGLRGRGDVTPLGAAGVTAGALLGPLSMAVVPLLNKSGQLGKDGDLIIAVDDRRIHSEFDFSDELRKLKPGDTVYLTVVRPTDKGGHQTVKIPVKVGGQSSDAAAAAPPYDPYSAESPY